MPTDADRAHRHWLRGHIDRAAAQFGVAVVGQPVYGWHNRTIGAPVTAHGAARWLRVVSEHRQWAAGDFWTGNLDANAITGVHRPRVLDHRDWIDADQVLRAELMTLAPGQPIAPGAILRMPIDLDDIWWMTLRTTLGALATQPTRRVCLDPQTVSRRTLAYFGVRTDPAAVPWTTAHGDLHWGNLTEPDCWLLD